MLETFLDIDLFCVTDVCTDLLTAQDKMFPEVLGKITEDMELIYTTINN